jgi:hypothetical protein
LQEGSRGVGNEVFVPHPKVSVPGTGAQQGGEEVGDRPPGAEVPGGAPEVSILESRGAGLGHPGVDHGAAIPDNVEVVDVHPHFAA